MPATIQDKCVAKASNRNAKYNDLSYWLETNLYRTSSGRLYTQQYGGSQVRVNNRPMTISRADAIDFIATEARDIITGYGYTSEQAEIMTDGREAGPGYRGDE